MKLHRKEQKKSKSRRKGQKETRVQDGLDSSKTGGSVGRLSEPFSNAKTGFVASVKPMGNSVFVLASGEK